MTDADNLIPTPTPVGRKGFPIKVIPGTTAILEQARHKGELPNQVQVRF